MTQDVRSQMARGAIWMLLFKLVDRSIGFLSTLILARLLTPDNFGVMAMAMSLIALLELIGAFGFDMALIQRASATREHYDTAWTFNVIFGSTIGLLMIALADVVANFYDTPNLSWVIRALAISSILQGFGNIGVVAFRKDMEFHKEFKFLLSKRLATFPVTIILAVILHNYWALVIGIITGRIVELCISYWVHPYRPKLTLAAAKDLLHFSKWLLVLNVLSFFRERSSDFVVGRLGGAQSLGLFNVSYELANLPGTELVAPINRAVFPAYARIADDRPALQREYLSVMGMISLIAIPAVAGLAATANLIVPVALGKNWLAAIPVLQLLAFFGITQVMQSNAYALCLALGKANLFARIQLMHVVVLITFLIIFMRWKGLIGAAGAYPATAVISLPITFIVVLRMLQLSTRRFLAELWRPLLSAIGMFLAVTTYIGEVSVAAPTGELIRRLLAAVALGAFAYVALVIVMWFAAGKPESAEHAILERAKPFLRSLPKKLGLR